MDNIKCSTMGSIYINPKFRDPIKTVHINPKISLSAGIHVNPKMIKNFATSKLNELQQLRVDTSVIERPLSESKLPVPKSVYVHPKLVEKLKKPKILEQNNDKHIFQPPNSSGIPAQTQSKTVLQVGKNFSTSKLSPTNLVSLSKRKLVRIRPNSNVKSINSPSKIVKTTTRPLTANRSKKFNSVNLKASPVSKTKSCLQTATRFKIDRTGVQKKKVIKVKIPPKVDRRTNKNLIKIDGVLYKSSKSQLVKSNNCSNRASDPKRKSSSGTSNAKKIVRRSSLALKTITKYRATNIDQKLNYKYVLSNRVKQKSIQILRHKMTKNNQPCLLYQRFGFCAKYTAGTCPKVHDKKRVALCKNFLQGKCLLDNCRLSHEVVPEKMPTCKYFLDGCCIRDGCPYLHVKVSSNTPICVAFLQGYCATGDKCKQRHINICPEFEKTNKCSKGKKCPYPHKTILVQHKTARTAKTTGNFKKSIVEKNVDKLLPPRDESVKRYYDDSSNNTLDAKREKILREISVVKKIHYSAATLEIPPDSTDNVHQYEDSQPCHENSQYKRPPIGHLPSYIPL